MMAEVAGAAVGRSATAKAIWQQFLLTDDISVLQRACGNGHDVPDTQEAALLYSLTYQNPHYDALSTALASAPPGPMDGSGLRWLVVDVGAGPATGLLAASAELRRRSGEMAEVSYVHIERLGSMRSLAQAFFQADGDIAKSSTFLHVDDAAGVVPADMVRWLEGCGAVLFVFSYVLCQRHARIRLFSDLVVSVCHAAAPRPAILVMADAKLDRCGYPRLGRMLKYAGFPSPPEPTVVDHTSRFLNADGSVRQTRSQSQNLQYAYLRLQ